MTIIFYNFTAEDILADKTEFLQELRTMSGCYFKQPASILAPYITIQSTVQPIELGNYCFIEDLNKYYFIVDIVSINNNLWGLQLKEDVLMTYKHQFLQLTAYIARQENIYNKYMIDSYRPVNDKLSVSVSKIKDSLSSTADLVFGKEPYFVVTYMNDFIENIVVNRENYDKGYVGITDNVPDSELFPNNKGTTSIITNDFVFAFQILNAINKSSEFASFITSIYMLPMDRDYVIGNTTPETQITIHGVPFTFKTGGAYNKYTIILRERINNNTITTSGNTMEKEFRLSLKKYLFNDYRDFEPYTLYEIYLPYYGWYNIKGEILQTLKQPVARYVFDQTNGVCTIYLIEQDKYILDTISFDFMIQVPKNSSNLAEIQRADNAKQLQLISKVIMTAISTAGAAAVAGISAGATAAIGGLHGANTIAAKSANINSNAKLESGAISAGFSGTNDLIGSAVDYATFKIMNVPRGVPQEVRSTYLRFFGCPYFLMRKSTKTIMDDNEYVWFRALHGAPLYSIRGLSALKGFTVVQDIHLTGVIATEEEKALLLNTLKNGVIL